MRVHLFVAICLAATAAACRSASNQRTYMLQGQVLSVSPDHSRALIKHEEIKGFMAAMTMSYKVKDPQLLNAVAPGDLVTATLVVTSNDAYLTDIKKVGHAPLEQPATEAPPARSGFELLKPGEPVPDASFLDQDGKKRTFASFKGSPVAVTFIYTQCPLPTFCPLMDRHFASMQPTIKTDPALKKVHLLSVSFDPLTDTPPALKKHAGALGADPARWTFLTGDRDDIDRFAARFGILVSRALNNPRDITHNLRTAIVDADGKLVKVYTGNEWTPDQVLAELRTVAQSSW